MAKEFPDDENGDVLRRMHVSGDDLTHPREVDFTAVVPDEIRARKLAQRFEGRGYVVTVKNSAVVPELPWDVTVSAFIVPTHKGITELEDELGATARSLGGRNDGWGCFEKGKAKH